MTTVEEIVAAAARLQPAQLLELRQHLDALEARLWQVELAATTAELREANITEENLDQLVLKRRHEGRR